MGDWDHRKQVKFILGAILFEIVEQRFFIRDLIVVSQMIMISEVLEYKGVSALDCQVLFAH